MTAQLRFAANLKWLFDDVPLAERFDAAAAAGFAGVEIPDPYSLSVTELQRRLADAGLAAVLVNTPAGQAGTPGALGLACLPDHADEYRATVSRALEYVSAVGCTVLHVVAGRVPRSVDRDRAMETFVDNIAWTAAQAKPAAISVVLEMQNQRSAPGYLLRSQAEAQAVAAAVGEPVGLLFDFFHTQVAQGDVTTVYESVFPWIKHIQIGDGPARTEPGTGELSWPFVFRSIQRSGYDGWLGCEFQPTGAPEHVLTRLGRLI